MKCLCDSNVLLALAVGQHATPSRHGLVVLQPDRSRLSAVLPSDPGLDFTSN